MLDSQKPLPSGPAARQRRLARQALAPYVEDLSLWHRQAARLFVELERQGQSTTPDPATAARELLTKVRDRETEFARKAQNLPPTSRIDDVTRALARLRLDLENAIEPPH